MSIWQWYILLNKSILIFLKRIDPPNNFQINFKKHMPFKTVILTLLIFLRVNRKRLFWITNHNTKDICFLKIQYRYIVQKANVLNNMKMKYHRHPLVNDVPEILALNLSSYFFSPIYSFAFVTFLKVPYCFKSYGRWRFRTESRKHRNQKWKGHRNQTLFKWYNASSW